MKVSLPWRIGSAAAVLAAGLVSLVVHEAQARAGGTQVLLPMEAIDPRSLLSGHYAQLRLSQALAKEEACPPGTAFEGSNGFRAGSPSNQWVALEPDGKGHHRVAGMAASREDAASFGPVQVRGEASCSGQGLWLNIGVDRFHAQQRRAEALEARLRSGPNSAFAVVSVGRDGRARLNGVLVAGQRIDLPML